MSLGDFERVLPALASIRLDHPRDIDWVHISESLGTGLPPDFMDLSEHYSSFAIDDFLSVRLPRPGMERRYVASLQRDLRDLEELRSADAAGGYAPYPENHGLLPWGETIDGDRFYWRTLGSDGSKWTVVIAGRNGDWVEFDGSLTSYLAGLVSGEVAPDGLPPDFPGSSPSVKGY